MAKHNPVVRLVFQFINGIPCALHEQHILFAEYKFRKIIGVVVAIAQHAQYVDIESVAEVKRCNCLLEERSVGHGQYFGQTYVIELQVAASVITVGVEYQAVILYKSFYILARTTHKEYIAGVDSRSRSGSFLRYVSDKMSRSIAHAEFEHIEFVI